MQTNTMQFFRWLTVAGLIGVGGFAPTSAKGGKAIGPNPTPPSQADYSVQSIIESGQRGGALIPVGTNFSRAYNRAMGEAMELWNAHQWAPAVKRLEAIYQHHPESPWAVEARLHVGCFCRFNALYDEAEDHFIAVLAQCADNDAIKKKVLLHLPDVYYKTGRVRAAKAALEMLNEMPLEWNRRQFLENWRLLYFNAIALDDTNRLCGVKAAALALEAQQQGAALRNVALKQIYKKHTWAMQSSRHADGYSLRELARLSGGVPCRLTFAELQQQAQPEHPMVAFLSAPAEPKLFVRLNRQPPSDYRKPSGHFVVVEHADEQMLTVLEPNGGRERWSAANFQYRWSGLVLMPSTRAANAGEAVDDATAQAARGGCCGSPPPDTDNGDPCDDDCECDNNGGGGGDESGGGSGGCSSCGGGDGYGAPKYKFILPNRNVLLKDIPIWYPDAKGPGLALHLTYNRTDSQDGALYDTNITYHPFGAKWSCNFSSFIKQDPAQNITAVLGGGQHEVFNVQSDGVTYTNDSVRRFNQLTITNGYARLTFRRSQSAYLFDTNSQHVTAVEDRYGNALQYQYDGSGRLTQVTDAAGRTFSFSYNGAGLVSQVADALNRAAIFDYTNGNLVGITDMGGYKTSISYDTNNWVTTVSYPNGSQVHFDYTKAADLGSPYYGYQYPFRIRAVDSLAQTNELFYHSFSSMGPITIRLCPEYFAHWVSRSHRC